jgi:outer membrane protein TolC
MSDDWKVRFRELYHSAQERYRAGSTTTLTLFEADEVYFLATKLRASRNCGAIIS